MRTLQFAFLNPQTLTFGIRRRGDTRCISNGSKVTCQASFAGSLGEAVERGFVRKFGRIIDLDASTSVPSDDVLRIPKEWDSSLLRVREAILDMTRRHRVHAVFVRGSIVTGNFFEDGKSDLDLVVCTEMQLEPTLQAALRTKIRSLVSSRFTLSGVDISFIYRFRRIRGDRTFRYWPTLTMIRNLRYYSVPIHGSFEALELSDDIKSRTALFGVNIRAAERKVISVFNQSSSQNDEAMQLVAIQWICKKCIRTITEIASVKTRMYSRDLYPCFVLCAEAFDSYSGLILKGLQLVCASTENDYLGFGRSTLVTKGIDIAQDLVEVVEELALRNLFGSSISTTAEAHTASTSVIKSKTVLERLSARVVEVLARCRPMVYPELRNVAFRQVRLPHIAVFPHQTLREEVGSTSISRVSKREKVDLTSLLERNSAPRVFREIVPSSTRRDATTWVLEELIRSDFRVQCRESETNVVTFCRPTHEWIEDGFFSPPSKLKSFRTKDAIERLFEENRHANGKQYNREFVYIQTRAPTNLRLFKLDGSESFQVAQEERIWISGGGTVSSLHYDASHSCLFQRSGTKRMIFFPPECLAHMGIYPLGHPLHRRARVNLSRRRTKVFESFWRECASKAVEVVLRPGDLIVFPPFWSHYTESIAERTSELSISHTFRYLF